MRKTRHIVPLALAAGLLVSCTATQHRLKRVRISQPRTSEAVADTGYRLPQQITWTDDKGEQHIVTEAARDSVTGEYITQMELAEITVVARSKQVAERNGKINLDFVVTVPGELINNAPTYPCGLQTVGYVVSGQDFPFRGGFCQNAEERLHALPGVHELHHP